MAGVDRQQTQDLLREITGVFTQPDEPQVVREVVRLHADMNSIAGDKRAGSQRTLASARERNENLMNQATRKEDPAAHAERVRQQQTKQAALKRSIEQLTRQREQLQADLAAIQTQKRHIIAQTEEQDQNRMDQVPRAKSSVDLFAKVTNVCWTSDQPTSVKGFVSAENGKEVRPFEFNPRETPRAVVADQLWAMME